MGERFFIEYEGAKHIQSQGSGRERKFLSMRRRENAPEKPSGQLGGARVSEKALFRFYEARTVERERVGVRIALGERSEQKLSGGNDSLSILIRYLENLADRRIDRGKSSVVNGGKSEEAGTIRSLADGSELKRLKVAFERAKQKTK